MEQRDRTPDRPTDHGSRGGYGAALVWVLACLALYGWQLIGIAGG